MSLPIPGVYNDMPFQEYLNLDAVSRSDLVSLIKSPGHYHYKKRAEDKPTSAMILGSMVHELLLEPAVFYKSYVAEPESINKRTKVGKKEYELFLAENSSKTVVPIEQWDLAFNLVDLLKSHPTVNKLMQKGVPEQTLVWKDEERDLMLKARLDWMRQDGIIIDLKTTNDASAGNFRRSIVNGFYDLQTAHYCEGYKQLTGKPVEAFIHMAVETKEPFGVAFYALDDASIEAGQEIHKKLLDRYVDEIKNGTESNYNFIYSKKIQDLALPAYGFDTESRII